MRTLFFDTSALAKRYAEEPGTETVDQLVDAADTTIVITSAFFFSLGFHTWSLVSCLHPALW